MASREIADFLGCPALQEMLDHKESLDRQDEMVTMATPGRRESPRPDPSIYEGQKVLQDLQGPQDGREMKATPEHLVFREMWALAARQAREDLLGGEETPEQ